MSTLEKNDKDLYICENEIPEIYLYLNASIISYITLIIGIFTSFKIYLLLVLFTLSFSRFTRIHSKKAFNSEFRIYTVSKTLGPDLDVSVTSANVLIKHF